MKKFENIVAAELLSVKDKVSLLDAIALPAFGNHIAGLPGALVGAALVPSKLLYKWRVLYDDGTHAVRTLKGDDPRNDFLMNLPYLSEYEAYMESETEMTEDTFVQPQYVAPLPSNSAVPQVPVATSASHNNNSTTIGAGYYEFGANFPNGMFNLECVSGEGTLHLKDNEGYGSFVDLGGSDDARSFSGLSSSVYKSFMIDGSLVLKVTRAQMIQI